MEMTASSSSSNFKRAAATTTSTEGADVATHSFHGSKSSSYHDISMHKDDPSNNNNISSDIEAIGDALRRAMVRFLSKALLQSMIISIDSLDCRQSL